MRIYVQCFDGGYGNHFTDMKFVCLCEQRFEVFCFLSEKDTISINSKSMIFHEIKFCFALEHTQPDITIIFLF